MYKPLKNPLYNIHNTRNVYPFQHDIESQKYQKELPVHDSLPYTYHHLQGTLDSELEASQYAPLETVGKYYGLGDSVELPMYDPDHHSQKNRYRDTIILHNLKARLPGRHTMYGQRRSNEHVVYKSKDIPFAFFEYIRGSLEHFGSNSLEHFGNNGLIFVSFGLLFLLWFYHQIRK